MATITARQNPHQQLGPRARLALANLLRYTSVVQIIDALKNLGERICNLAFDTLGNVLLSM